MGCFQPYGGQMGLFCPGSSCCAILSSSKEDGNLFKFHIHVSTDRITFTWNLTSMHSHFPSRLCKCLLCKGVGLSVCLIAVCIVHEHTEEKIDSALYLIFEAYLHINYINLPINLSCQLSRWALKSISLHLCREKFLVLNFVTLYHIVIFWNIINVSVLDCYVE